MDIDEYYRGISVQVDSVRIRSIGFGVDSIESVVTFERSRIRTRRNYLVGYQTAHQLNMHRINLDNMAQALYRSLLRATRVAFTGDGRTLLAAREKIRHEFQQKASLSPSDPAFGKAIKYAQDVALILRHNVVQGQSDGNDLYRLNIHDDIERGDNDSVKHTTSKLANKTGGCGCN